MNRLFTITILLITTIISISNAEGWMQTYGDSLSDYGFWVEQMPDAGYIITGLLALEGDGAPSLVRTDSLGNLLWSRTYDYSFGYSGRCVQLTSNGGFIVTGDGGDVNLILLAMDSLGNLRWEKTYGKNAVGYCVRETKDSGYVTVAKRNIYPPLGSSECWLLKTNSFGDTLWTRSYKGDSVRCAGYSLLVLEDGSYVIAGFNGPGVWLMHTDENGDSLWSQTYMLGDNSRFDAGYSIEQTSDGGYIITGVTDGLGFALAGALFLLKVNSQGDSLWTKIYDPTSVWDAGASVHQTPDGGYIVAGTQDFSIQHTGTIWLLRTDSEGDMLWQRTFDGDPDARGDCLTLCADRGYAITGFVSVNGSPDIVLIKTDSLGYVGVEAPTSPLTPPPPLWDVVSAVGSQITLKYKYLPEGFALTIYDTSGRKVDEIQSPNQSGVLIWGPRQNPGVYFILLEGSKTKPVKVVLTR